MDSYMFFIDTSGGLRVRKGSENWSKLTTFGHFQYIFTSEKLEMNTFSGSTNSWRLLVNYEPLHVLL